RGLNYGAARRGIGRRFKCGPLGSCLLQAGGFAHKTRRFIKARASAPPSGRTGWIDKQEGGTNMKKAFWLAGYGALAPVQPAAAAGTIKIGFISTFSGPPAAIGNDMRNSFELALDHLGRKMGGKPVEVIYEDDGQKPDVGKQKTEKLIQSDRVDFVVGY